MSKKERRKNFIIIRMYIYIYITTLTLTDALTLTLPLNPFLMKFMLRLFKKITSYFPRALLFKMKLFLYYINGKLKTFCDRVK